MKILPFEEYQALIELIHDYENLKDLREEDSVGHAWLCSTYIVLFLERKEIV